MYLDRQVPVYKDNDKDPFKPKGLGGLWIIRFAKQAINATTYCANKKHRDHYRVRDQAYRATIHFEQNKVL